MKRKNIAILFSIIIILLAFIILKYEHKEETFVENGITYALRVNGEITSTMPEKGLYKVDVMCANSNAYWDYDNWKLNIENITGDVSCNLEFTSIEQTNLNTYITSLVGTPQKEGKLVNENGYRYQGKNPNNYILFNNELWRIIGVFGDNRHGITGQNLVKIIRNNTIGGYVYNSLDNAIWSGTSLYKLLNPVEGDSNSGFYYNKQNATNSGYCYGYGSRVPTNCDFRINGISDEYRPMIKNVTWYLDGFSGSNITPQRFYEKEISSTSSATGYIGLMYVSDFGYSTPVDNCPRTTSFTSYTYSGCYTDAWLFGKTTEWTINQAGGITSQVAISSDSRLTNAKIYGYGVRPTLYLDESVYVLDGDGSLLDPYIIAMD